MTVLISSTNESNELTAEWDSIWGLVGGGKLLEACLLVPGPFLSWLQLIPGHHALLPWCFCLATGLSTKDLANHDCSSDPVSQDKSSGCALWPCQVIRKLTNTLRASQPHGPSLLSYQKLTRLTLKHFETLSRHGGRKRKWQSRLFWPRVSSSAGGEVMWGFLSLGTRSPSDGMSPSSAHRWVADIFQDVFQYCPTFQQVVPCFVGRINSPCSPPPPSLWGCCALRTTEPLVYVHPYSDQWVDCILLVLYSSNRAVFT